MTRLPRLTLAAALLGGMALPAASFAAVVHTQPEAVTSKLHHRAHRAAATSEVTSEVTSKDAPTKGATTKDVMPRDAAKPAPAVRSTQASPSAVSPETVKPTMPSMPSATAKPAAPGAASIAPAAKVN